MISCFECAQGRITWQEFIKYYRDATPEQRTRCLTCDMCGVVEPDCYSQAMEFYKAVGVL